MQLKKNKKYLISIMMSLMGSAFSLTNTELNIIDSVKKNKENEIAFIEKTVNINSGTLNLPGVKEVARVYKEQLETLGFQTRWIEMPASMNRAGHLFAYHFGSKEGKRILLIGHLDTVFSKDSQFQKFNRVNNMATGPGVVDMKGGNAVIIYALKALQENGQLDKANITVALMGDEENSGMPQSIARNDLIEVAKNQDIALAFEDSKNLSSIVTQRRGLVSWEFYVNAKAGHSSLIFTPEFGVGAILGLTHVLEKMVVLSQLYPDISFNPGVISGGHNINFEPDIIRAETMNKNNVVAEKALATGEIRFLSQKNLNEFIKAIHQQVDALTLPVKGYFTLLPKGKPPMVSTPDSIALFNGVREINEALGLDPLTEIPPREKGAADISFVAQYVPSLDGLGAIGDNDHSINEFMDINQTLMATQRMALLLLRLSNH